MPRRTTPFQAIVHLVRQHHAAPGVTVTESKFLHDPVLGPREVDIVVEADADGDPVVVSLEVNERGRVASVEWVEQQIDKHHRLPTNKLILVSRAGFSRKALTRVGLEQGKVEALQPAIIIVDGEPLVKRLYVDSIKYDPTRCTVHVKADSGEVIAVAGQPDRTSTTAMVYSSGRWPIWRGKPRISTRWASGLASRHITARSATNSRRSSWDWLSAAWDTTSSTPRPTHST